MKSCFIVLGLLLTTVTFCQAQQTKNKYASIDRYARSQGYPNTLKALAAKLTAPYLAEEDKVRSVFVWITAHITYDVTEKNSTTPGRYERYKAMVDLPEESDMYWNRVWATAALKDHMAVCAGYAALFKVLCDEAGIRSAIVEGNGRDYTTVGEPWVSNHAWNAVYMNGKWQLLDVTWASGYVNGTKAVREFNPYYYCTPPEEMIFHHYPDSLKWSLLEHPPSRNTYNERPYIFTCNGIIPSAYTPEKGVLDVQTGDVVRFSIEMKGPCDELDIYDETTGQWTAYKLTAPVVSPQPEKPGKKMAATGTGKEVVDKKEVTVIDSLVASLNAARKVSAKSASVKTDDAAGNSLPFFRKGDMFRFSYPVRHKGKHLIQIYCNGRSMMAYVVNGR